MKFPTFKYYADLCECGRLKYKTAKKCGFCCSSKGPSDPKYLYQYDMCPQCGGLKKKKAKLCRGCSTYQHSPEELLDKRPWYGSEPDYSRVPDWFWVWLSGFVCGEGSITFQSGNSLRLHISLHHDDRLTLVLIYETLGGSLYNNSDKRKLTTWSINGSMRVCRIIEKIMPTAVAMKSIKANDMQVALDYYQWRSRLGSRTIPPDQRHIFDQFKQRMKDVKVRSKVAA